MRQISTGILEVTRPSTYFAKFRAYPLFVDGEKVGAVKDGATQPFPLSPGSHEVWSRIDWKKSNTVKITIEAGNATRIKVEYKKKEGRKLFAPIALSLVAIALGAAFGIAILTVIGVVGIMLARVGDLFLNGETDA